MISELFSLSDGYIGYSATGGNRKFRNWIPSTWRKIDKNDKCLITSFERCQVRPMNFVNWLCDVLNILMIIAGHVFGLAYCVLLFVMSVLHPSVFSQSVTLSFSIEYSSNSNELWILFQPVLKYRYIWVRAIQLCHNFLTLIFHMTLDIGFSIPYFTFRLVSKTLFVIFLKINK